MNELIVEGRVVFPIEELVQSLSEGLLERLVLIERLVAVLEEVMHNATVVMQRLLEEARFRPPFLAWVIQQIGG